MLRLHRRSPASLRHIASEAWPLAAFSKLCLFVRLERPHCYCTLALNPHRSTARTASTCMNSMVVKGRPQRRPVTSLRPLARSCLAAGAAALGCVTTQMHTHIQRHTTHAGTLHTAHTGARRLQLPGTLSLISASCVAALQPPSAVPCHAHSTFACQMGSLRPLFLRLRHSLMQQQQQPHCQPPLRWIRSQWPQT